MIFCSSVILIFFSSNSQVWSSCGFLSSILLVFLFAELPCFFVFLVFCSSGHFFFYFSDYLVFWFFLLIVIWFFVCFWVFNLLVVYFSLVVWVCYSSGVLIVLFLSGQESSSTLLFWFWGVLNIQPALVLDVCYSVLYCYCYFPFIYLLFLFLFFSRWLNWFLTFQKSGLWYLVRRCSSFELLVFCFFFSFFLWILIICYPCVVNFLFHSTAILFSGFLVLFYGADLLILFVSFFSS